MVNLLLKKHGFWTDGFDAIMWQDLTKSKLVLYHHNANKIEAKLSFSTRLQKKSEIFHIFSWIFSKEVYS